MDIGKSKLIQKVEKNGFYHTVRNLSVPGDAVRFMQCTGNLLTIDEQNIDYGQNIVTIKYERIQQQIPITCSQKLDPTKYTFY